MNKQIRLPFAEQPDEAPATDSVAQELQSTGRIAAVRLSEDDFDIDPDRLEGDLT